MGELQAIFGSRTAEQVLLFLAANGQAYTRQISSALGVSPSVVAGQLRKFEDAGVLVQKELGRSKIYTWNPRWPYRQHLIALLDERLRLMADDERLSAYVHRGRPRRTGKPL